MKLIHHPCSNRCALRQCGYSLAEVMVVAGLLGILFLATFGGISSMIFIGHRTADYTAGSALLQAKIHDIRAANYTGANSIFSSTATTVDSNSISVQLNQAGTTFLVPGTLTSTIKPITWGHLVTVTLVVNEPNGLFMTNTLQTVVNQYSGGRGQ